MRRMLAMTWVLSVGCATVSVGGRGPTDPPTAAVRAGFVQEGQASYYADSLAGNSTASGEPYRPEDLTAAHRSLPLGTRVEVLRLDNGRRVTVRVNDRGPYASHRRIIDLSRAAASALGMLRAGVVSVRLQVLSVPARRR